jgi:hypothetical protein
MRQLEPWRPKEGKGEEILGTLNKRWGSSQKQKKGEYTGNFDQEMEDR